MSKALPTVTRTALSTGKFRYEVNGEVIIAASKVLYTHASAYDLTKAEGNKGVVCGFHKTEAAAFKGVPDLNRYCRELRIPGIVAITEGEEC